MSHCDQEISDLLYSYCENKIEFMYIEFYFKDDQEENEQNDIDGGVNEDAN